MVEDKCFKKKLELHLENMDRNGKMDQQYTYIFISFDSVGNIPNNIYFFTFNSFDSVGIRYTFEFLVDNCIRWISVDVIERIFSKVSKTA